MGADMIFQIADEATEKHWLRQRFKIYVKMCYLNQLLRISDVFF